MGRITKPDSLTVPFGMGAFRLYEAWCIRYIGKCYSDPRRVFISNFGSDKLFRNWLFDNYCAEIVKENKQTMIRFIDQHQLTMFMLKHGA